jgi:hypothetical protein
MKKNIDCVSEQAIQMMADHVRGLPEALGTEYETVPSGVAGKELKKGFCRSCGRAATILSDTEGLIFGIATTDKGVGPAPAICLADQQS